MFELKIHVEIDCLTGHLIVTRFPLIITGNASTGSIIIQRSRFVALLPTRVRVQPWVVGRHP